MPTVHTAQRTSPRQEAHPVWSRYVIVGLREAARATNARKARLRHGPELLSLVADCDSSRSPMAGRCPGRPAGHRQPGALGLGGAGAPVVPLSARAAAFGAFEPS